MNKQITIDVDKHILIYAIKGIRRAYFFAGFISSTNNVIEIKDFHPNEFHKLNFGEIPKDKLIENIEEFKSWVLKNSVREAIELFNNSLDKIFEMFIALGIETCVDSKKISKFSKFPFPQKLDIINKFLIEDISEQNCLFQSLQDIRNCITHKISMVDKKEGIKILLPKVELCLENKKGELMPIIIGELIKEESNLVVRFSNTEKFFKEGEIITFSTEEIVQICKALDKSVMKLRNAIINTLKNGG